MKSLYSRLAEQWDILFPPDLKRVEFLDKLLSVPGARVVELGCGSGATAVSLASLGGLSPSGVFRDWDGHVFSEDSPWLVSLYTRLEETL